MAVFKCKMCGGTLEVNNETIAVCQYCGTKQTLPKLDDDRKANLYDRANHFRRNNEFDKAMGIYEQILNEDNTDAEAYWSLVLCRYGIEYVEDPSSRKRIPTVNRAQFTSVFDDEDYKSALQFADGYQKEVYEQEATVINDIQKGILAISSQEKPFDVFICYKESDNSGRRTPDSVLATELYHELEREGLKVFFSRITLEDKLGQEYEPYIFAALNSAKVMVVLGTKAEYFNAVWVKNEWSRYLALIKNGAKKMLIPAYKDMDPYDLPEEFSHLQAQDMSKLGFMQDLIRGIKKIADAQAPKTAVVKETVVANGNTNAAPLLERAFMFLEDGDWNSADEYCEKVLDLEPKNANAYLGKLLAELHIKTQGDLKDYATPFDENTNYQKAIRFGNDELKSALTGYIEHINTRNENARLENIYCQAKVVMSSAKSKNLYQDAAHRFESISEYKDSSALAQKCYERAEIARKDAILEEAKTWMTNAISSCERAITMFESISGWKDADEQIIVCQKKIEEIKAKEEAERLEKERQAEIERKESERIAKKTKKTVLISLLATIAIVVFLFVLSWIIPNRKYNHALKLMSSGKYTEAISVFVELEGYKDSAAKIAECVYGDAIALMDSGKIIEAYEALIAMNGYKDSAEKASSIHFKYEVEKLKEAKIGDSFIFGSYEQTVAYDGKEDIEWIVLDIKDGKALVISKYALDCQQYNTSNTKGTWETCTLRKWLNNDFINATFSAEEKAMIPTVTVSADKNPDYNTDLGNATQDQVFLLSITEANKYFSSDSARQCDPTDYAVARGAYADSSTGNCWWWLRSSGDNQYNATLVYSNGDISKRGYSANSSDHAVRPAMWIDLNA